MVVFVVVEVDFVDFVDYLLEEGVVFYVVVGVFEDGVYDFGLWAEVMVEFF